MSDVAQTEFEQRVSQQDFVKVTTEMLRIKSNASEYVGQLGQYKRNQTERLGLNGTALAIHLRLKNMEPVKRRDIVRSLLQYELYDGGFDQMEAFDDTTILLERILEKIDEAASAGDNPSDNVVALNSLTAAE